MNTVKKVHYPNLRAEMARNGDKVQDIAGILGLSIPSTSRRLSGDIEWSKTEIDILCNRYQLPYEKLFLQG